MDRVGPLKEPFTRGISTLGELWGLWESSGRGLGVGELWSKYEWEKSCLAGPFNTLDR